MIQLLYYECIKLIKRRSFWILLCGVILIDFGLFQVERTYNDEHNLKQTYYEETMAYIDTLSTEQAFQWLTDERTFYDSINAFKLSQFLEDDEITELTQTESERYETYKDEESYWEERKIVINDVYDYIYKIMNYQNYQTQIKQNKENIVQSPLWNLMSEQEQEDVQLQAEAYAHLQDTKLNPVHYRTIERYAHALSVRLLSFLFLCALIILIWKEDEGSIHDLISSTIHGHQKNALIKIICFFCVGIVSVLMIQCMDFIWYLQAYGGCDFHAPIQSIPILYESSQSLTIGTWLIKNMIVFSILICLFSTVFIFLYHIFHNKILSFLLFFGFVFLEAVFYQNISESSIWLAWKHVNILQLFDPIWYGNFLSFQHLFTWRFSAQVSLSWICIMIALFSTICYVKFYDRRISIHMKRWVSLSCTNTYLWIQEGYRILLTNKGVFIILIVVLSTVLTWFHRLQTYASLQQNEQVVYEIYSQYAGEVTEDTKRNLKIKMESYANYEQLYQNTIASYKNKEITYDELQDAKTSYDMQMRDFPIYEKLYTEVEQGIPYILYDKGYQAIFSMKVIDRDVHQSVWIMAFVLFMCGAAAYHHQEEQLYQSTKLGNHVRLCFMFSHVWMICFLMALLVYALDYAHFAHLYPMDDFDVGLRTLFDLCHIPLPDMLQTWTIQQYLFALFGIRLLGVLSTCITVTFLFQVCKSRIIGFLISAFVLFLPMFLYYHELTFVSFFSLFDLFMGNLFLQNMFSVSKLLLLLLIDVGCLWMLFQKKRFLVFK